jgi:uncharacterized protein (DUF1697 family)
MPPTSKTWIALLRGVNVGGKNKLLMKDLAAELESLGFESIRTYIQSGNVVFHSSAARNEPAALSTAEIAASIASAIKNRFGFQPGVFVLSKSDLAAAAAANPFPDANQELDGKALHLFFLGDIPPKLDVRSLDAVKRPSFGNSKLAARAERCLGVPATARNWRTVCELLKLAEGSE